MQERICSKCGGPGPFVPRQNWCKRCKAAYMSKWRKAHPDKVRHYSAMNRSHRHEARKEYAFAYSKRYYPLHSSELNAKRAERRRKKNS